MRKAGVRALRVTPQLRKSFTMSRPYRDA